MIRIPLILIALLVLPLVAGCGGGGSGAAALSHIERPGLYAENTVELDAEGRDELRASGIALEDAGEFVAAAEYWYGVAYEHPRDPLAIEARHHRVSCLVQLREFWLAHQDMTVLVQLYKEWLLLTRYQAQWDELRRLWYEDIGLGLYFKDEKRDHLADNLDPAIKVFERLYKEEVRGRYSALCLLRLGDCRYQQQEYEEARNHYLRVVTSYADYQDHSEHEEAVYKSARATLAMMKGVDYNLDMIRSTGSETTSKGALDLCDDYDKNWPQGRFRSEVDALRSRIMEYLAWRDFEAAKVYDRLGQTAAARVQYQLVVKLWGDEQRFPAQQGYVNRAKQRIEQIPPPTDDTPR